MRVETDKKLYALNTNTALEGERERERERDDTVY